jgi:glycosyltransferase involved in cell wall biosynthesis
MDDEKKFLFLEPFYGGSHREFADGLIQQTKHSIDLVTLPARFWKWRMRGAALYFFKKIKSFSDYRGLIVTDLMSLADLKALCGPDFIPSLVYFHENQLTYPTAPDESIDYQFGFTNITTALAADKIYFNSKTHYNAFFSALPGFINMMPEYNPKWVASEIRQKADIMYPGCAFSNGKNINIKKAGNNIPLIVWNHRWEFDKNPKDFFHALDSLIERGLDFELALLGENFQTIPSDFIDAKERYNDRILSYGYVESREEYIEWLAKGDIVISTAIQENFGMSIVEAVRYGCIPLVPNRVSYPEIIPESFHSDFLYDSFEELVNKLVMIISVEFDQMQKKAARLAEHMETFSWKNCIQDYDTALEELSSRFRKR